MSDEIVKSDNLPESVFSGQGGPKAIGEVFRPIDELTEKGIKDQLKEAGEILVKKFGKELFQHEFGRKMKTDLIRLQMKPGSNYFITCEEVTIAVQNANKYLLVEVRRPGMPYQRGKITSGQLFREAIDSQNLLEG